MAGEPVEAGCCKTTLLNAPVSRTRAPYRRGLSRNSRPEQQAAEFGPNFIERLMHALARCDVSVKVGRSRRHLWPRKNAGRQIAAQQLERLQQAVDCRVVAPVLHQLAGMGGGGAVAAEQAADLAVARRPSTTSA